MTMSCDLAVEARRKDAIKTIEERVSRSWDTASLLHTSLHLASRMENEPGTLELFPWMRYFAEANLWECQMKFILRVAVALFTFSCGGSLLLAQEKAVPSDIPAHFSTP